MLLLLGSRTQQVTIVSCAGWGIHERSLRVITLLRGYWWGSLSLRAESQGIALVAVQGMALLQNHEIALLESQVNVLLESQDIALPESQDISLPESQDISLPESQDIAVFEGQDIARLESQDCPSCMPRHGASPCLGLSAPAQPSWCAPTHILLAFVNLFLAPTNLFLASVNCLSGIRVFF